jgi:signal transduction histidine kinase
VRISEIEAGVIPDVLEVIKEQSEIINFSYRLVTAAKDEILIIFHTSNALLRQEKAGGLELLIGNAIKYKTRVRILVPIEDKIIGTIKRLERINDIRIRDIEPTMQTRMTILVVDKTYSLVVELKDDSKENLEEAIGLATYSNSKATVLSYVSIFHTLWKQSELREELINRSTAQQEFINIAAHELRTPIQPILGISDVILHSDILSDSNKNNKINLKETVQIIARNARRLQRLAEDILDITKIEGRNLILNMHSFILSKIVEETVQDYTGEIRDSNRSLTLSFAISKELESTLIIADQDRIKQVISNLIDNAIKFTKVGKITVTAEIDNKHNLVTVKVTDTGTGIDSDILPKLFTKFVTRSSTGTGLGLYICKAIIDAHNGMIWAENNYDHNNMNAGATFSFSLPLDT